MALDPAPPSHDDLVRRIDALVGACRAQGLWFLRPDYRPATDGERLSVLTQLQRSGSLDLFRQAGLLKTWLSRHSSDASAGS